MNKKGWIEIIEAVTAMLIIAAVILILLNQNYSKEENLSEKMHDIEIAILREIQFNTTLRGAILNISVENLPVRWDDETIFPPALRQKITERTPESTICVAMICEPASNCLMEGLGRRDIYVQSVVINPTPGFEDENWKRLKIFCYSEYE